MKKLTIKELAEYRADGFNIVDMRPFEEFASGFLSGSIFLFPGDRFFSYLKLFFNNGKKIIIISDKDPDMLINFSAADYAVENIAGYTNFDREQFSTQGLPVDLLIDVEPDELAMDIRFDQNVLMVDLREQEYYEKEHVDGALPLPLDELADVAQIAALDDEGHLYFYSDNPYDPLTAASLLKRQGMHDVRVVTAGWSGIKKESGIKRIASAPKKSN